ncbi:hypothetical protein ACWGI8_00470 [Streptomyces sp. NPDC054841]
MSDQYAHPQQAASLAAAAPPAPEPQGAAPAAAPPAQVIGAQAAWIDGYEPGNPWQARLCLQTQYGPVVYPLTPHTMPELLEGLVMVAQEQQGTTDILGPEDPAAGSGADEVDDSEPGRGTGLHDGRAARLTGWAVVHDLWERDDPKARFIMGAVVIGLLVLGIFLT